MSEAQGCDVCGRSASELARERSGKTALTFRNGLWLCSDCRTRSDAQVDEAPGEGELSTEIKALVGKSAGAICFTLNLPYEPPYTAVVDAASTIAYDQDRFMSTWSFQSLWLDGTTLWRSEDGDKTALVHADGSVLIQSA